MTPTAEFRFNGTHCPLCGSDSIVPRDAIAFDTDPKQPMTVMECLSCHLAWQWPLQRRVDESVTFFEASYAKQKEGTYFDPSRKRQICEVELGFLATLRDKPTTLLDIGCGDGVFIDMAAEAGWSAMGLDPAATPRKGPPEIIRGTLDDLPGGLRFDAITLWDVVEHLEEPLSVIEACRERLNPGGWLVMESGNFLSVDRVTSGKGWWAYQFDHRWYFSPDTLRELLRRAGFASFALHDSTPRPWIDGTGHYAGPSASAYVKRSIKRPWRVLENKAEFDDLQALARSHPDTAGLNIFVLGARKTA